MIQPIYVTFEQAKALKEKGFDIKCSHFYNEGSGFKLQNDSLVRTGKDVFYEAPEQWQVVEWFRQKGIIIELIVDGWGDDDCVSEEFLCYRIFIWQVGKPKPHYNDDVGALPTPQEAYSVAIDNVLRYIL